MASKYFCDICNKETKDAIRVGWRHMYCSRCWVDKKSWPKIHKSPKPDEDGENR